MPSNTKKCLVYCQCAGEFLIADELIIKRKESIRVKNKKKENTRSTRKEKKVN